tara:strand:+ start:55 stop:2316 length:2262 start_codon:yes stop_codon:yes gene_type:complete
MTTRYIDLNASQASKINSTNNRYTYKLNKTLELPTGTQISVQNSLINLQGITGESIELEKDFEETIIYNYYLVDTFYRDPVGQLPVASNQNRYRVYEEAAFKLNPKNSATFQISDDIKDGLAGFSENIMPLAGWRNITNSTGTGNFLVPLIGKADIKIPKGIYSVSSLAELITNQINAVTLPESNENFLDVAKKNNEFNGMLVNNTTNRIINTPPREDLKTWQDDTGTEGALNNAPPFTSLPDIRALTVNDNNIVGAFACKPNHMADLFYQAKINDYDATVADNSARTRVFKSSLTAAPDPARRYGLVFTRLNNLAPADAARDQKYYDLFQKGTGVGTASFSMSYKNSGYAISHLHEPIRIPTNDRLGNALQGASQEAFFMKRVPTPSQVTGTDRLSNIYDGILTDDQKNKTYNTLSAPAQQYSGILVYNWAYQTCLNSGNRSKGEVLVRNDANSTYAQEFWNFNEFFKTDEEAKKAWESTLWFRMGFTYEQIQKKENYKSQYWYGESHALNGITTGADVDSTALPFMSSIYNNYSRAAEQKPLGDQGIALPAVNAIQLFNLMDSNVPPCPFNNNKKATLPANPHETLPINVYTYTSSDYEEAITIPVQTAGLDLIADDLPRLSINGYMLCLSDIINQDDQAGDLSDCGILDLIPKSSLSNQDFIADRNLLVHTLSNPKTVNYVNINILNPDLTDISLEPNTTILLKITTPIPKPTILMAESQEEIAEEQVKEEQANLIQQQEKQLLKQEKKS